MAWFSLFSVVLILAITFYQGLLGLFTGVINCMVTLLSAALAFGLYEDVYFAFLVSRQPDHGRTIALLGIFVIAQLVLRTIFDAAITGNQKYPVYVDRVGGGIFGFITAMLIVGTLATGMQMLSFSWKFLGFTRYALVDDSTGEPIDLDPSDRRGKKEDNATQHVLASKNDEFDKIRLARRSVWLSPDGFTVGLISYLSNNALAGRNRLSDVYPDFLGYAHRNRFNPLGQARQAVPPDALRVDGYWDLPENMLHQLVPASDRDEKGNPKVKFQRVREPPEPGCKRMVIRVLLQDTARDENRHYHFSTEQVRLVGRASKDAKLKEYFLVGIQDVQYPYRRVQVFPGQGISRAAGGLDTFDFVFEVEEEFEPVFIEYKRNARAEIRPSQDKNDEQPKPLSLLPEKGEKKGDGGHVSDAGSSKKEKKKSKGDRVSGLGKLREARFSNEMPFRLAQYSGREIELRGGEIRGGYLTAQLGRDWQPKEGNKQPIDSFEVPSGKLMLQLSVEKLHPESWLGNVYGGIIDTLGDFYLVDTKGLNHRVVGSYAIAKVGGLPTFELVYLDPTAREAGTRVRRFETIKRNHLKGDYVLFYLFHVPPGTHPKELHTGRTNVDLTGLDLQAPR